MREKKEFQLEFKCNLVVIQGPIINSSGSLSFMLIGDTESDKKLNFTLVDKGDGNFMFKTVFNNKSFYIVISW